MTAAIGVLALWFFGCLRFVHVTSFVVATR